VTLTEEDDSLDAGRRASNFSGLLHPASSPPSRRLSAFPNPQFNQHQRQRRMSYFPANNRRTSDLFPSPEKLKTSPIEAAMGMRRPSTLLTAASVSARRPSPAGMSLYRPWQTRRPFSSQALLRSSTSVERAFARRRSTCSDPEPPRERPAWPFRRRQPKPR